MKKKILGVLAIILAIGIMPLCLTGCGKELSSNSKVKSMRFLTDEYVFISTDTYDWKLMDLNGNLVLDVPDDYVPDSKVVNGYFFAKSADGTNTKFFKIDGTEPYAEYDVTPYTLYPNGKDDGSNYIYVVRVNEIESSIDGDITTEKMYSITDNFKDITNKFKYDICNIGINENPGFKINPDHPKENTVYYKSNNGYFVHMKDNQELYTPIKGEATIDSGNTTNLLALIDGAYYIVSEDGTKEEISYIPEGFEVVEYCNGYIGVARYNEYGGPIEYRLYDSNGKEINFNI